MTQPTESRRRGRPPADLACVIRNRLWALGVRQRGLHSWDQLDEVFLGLEKRKDAPRPRTFWSIARSGIEPLSSLRVQANVDLVGTVDAFAEYEGTSAVYHSRLWDLLKLPGSSRSDRIRLLSKLHKERKLFHADWNLRYHGNWILPKEPAFRHYEEGAIANVLALMAGSESLDDVAMFACEFRDAIDRLELKAANEYLMAVRTVLHAATKRLGSPDDLTLDLVRIVEKRLLRDDWSELPQSSLSFKRRVRQKSAPQMPPMDSLRRIIDSGAHLTHYWQVVPEAPIVPMNPRLEWFMDNRRTIYDAYIAAGSPSFSDAILEDARPSKRSSTEELARESNLPEPPPE